MRPCEPPMLIRFPRHYAGHCLAHVHGVGIHDPCHSLLVGIHVRRGHVLLRPDKLDDLGGVTARHALQLAPAHRLGVADHSALGAAEGNIHHRALPCHPAGQCAHLIQRHIRRVADAALARAARNVMLHAKARENVDHAVVERHREVHNDLALRRAQHLPQPFVQIQLARRKIEARVLRFPGIDLLVERHLGGSCRHKLLHLLPRFGFVHGRNAAPLLQLIGAAANLPESSDPWLHPAPRHRLTRQRVKCGRNARQIQTSVSLGPESIYVKPRRTWL